MQTVGPIGSHPPHGSASRAIHCAARALRLARSAQGISPYAVEAIPRVDLDVEVPKLEVKLLLPEPGAAVEVFAAVGMLALLSHARRVERRSRLRDASIEGPASRTNRVSMLRA